MKKMGEVWMLDTGETVLVSSRAALGLSGAQKVTCVHLMPAICLRETVNYSLDSKIEDILIDYQKHLRYPLNHSTGKTVAL